MFRLFFITGFVLLQIFFSGCNSQKVSTLEDDGTKNVISEQRQLIRENISDPDRQAKLLGIVEDVEKESAQFFTFYEEQIRHVKVLAVNQKTIREEFQKRLDEINDNYEKYLRMLVAKREEMRLMTSADEWDIIMNRKTSFLPL
jgi:hypothetical protein